MIKCIYTNRMTRAAGADRRVRLAAGSRDTMMWCVARLVRDSQDLILVLQTKFKAFVCHDGLFGECDSGHARSGR